MNSLLKLGLPNKSSTTLVFCLFLPTLAWTQNLCLPGGSMDDDDDVVGDNNDGGDGDGYGYA